MASSGTTYSNNIIEVDSRVSRILHKAVMRKEWDRILEICRTEKVEPAFVKISEYGFTLLHAAVHAFDESNVAFNIVRNTINPELLVTFVDAFRMNLAHHAAIYGKTTALQLMWEINPDCIFSYEKYGILPLDLALRVPHTCAFRYLFDLTKGNEYYYNKICEGRNGYKLLCDVIDKGLTDVAYVMIKDNPGMVTQVYEDVETPLKFILTKQDLFYSGARYNFYQRLVYRYVPIKNHCLFTYTADIENQETTKKEKFVAHSITRYLHKVSHIKRLKEDKVKHNEALKLLTCICEEVEKANEESDSKQYYKMETCLAAESNIAEGVDLMTSYFESALFFQKDGYNILQLAILNRSEKVYNVLINDTGINDIKLSMFIDDDKNNLLHLAGRLAPKHRLNLVSGAALQMQRELQWFEEVKTLVLPGDTQTQNNQNETPIMVFRREHDDLRKEGEEWMKKTADSYTITAGLIITIVFAAAITVPGGNNGDNGKPIFAKEASFIIFAVSDAISLFTSTTSLLLFLSILTARYADEDFLYKLPKRLIFGLVMLFVSVTTMMIAFSATLYIMFGQGQQWILIPIAVLTSLPIASFMKSQFPLLVEIISSTYGRGIFRKRNDRRWYQVLTSNKA